MKTIGFKRARLTLFILVVLVGMFAFGCLVAITLAFATESQPPSSLLMRAMPWSFYSVWLLALLLAIGAIWRTLSTGRFTADAWVVFTLGLASLLYFVALFFLAAIR